MQIHMIEKEIDGHGVVHGNGHLAGGSNDFDIVARGRYVQVLNGLEDRFADLLFGLRSTTPNLAISWILSSAGTPRNTGEPA